MANVTYNMPESFNFEPADWPRWKARFSRFRIGSELNNKPEDVQISTLLYCMGDRSEDIHATFDFSEKSGTFDDVFEKFDSYFTPRKNVVFERDMFHQRKQLPFETIDTFIIALHKLSESCEFGSLTEELIRDRIITGMIDRQLSESLQMDPDLTLQIVKEKAQQSELIKSQQPSVAEFGQSLSNVACQPVKLQPACINMSGSDNYLPPKPEDNAEMVTSCVAPFGVAQLGQLVRNVTLQPARFEPAGNWLSGFDNCPYANYAGNAVKKTFAPPVRAAGLGQSVTKVPVKPAKFRPAYKNTSSSSNNPHPKFAGNAEKKSSSAPPVRVAGSGQSVTKVAVQPAKFKPIHKSMSCSGNNPHSKSAGNTEKKTSSAPPVRVARLGQSVTNVAVQSAKFKPAHKNMSTSGSNPNPKPTPAGNAAKKTASSPSSGGRLFCGRCGARPSHNPEDCPAKSSICRNCNIRGHWDKMCRTRTVNKTTMVSISIH